MKSWWRPMMCTNNIIRLVGLVVMTGLMACAGDSAHVPENPVPADPLEGFRDFPDSLFEGIYWEQTLAECRNNLKDNGYELLDSSGVYTYYKPSDSTTVLVPDQPVISSFKLVLRSVSYQKATSELLNGLTSGALKAANSAQFSAFEYDLSGHHFKVTVFTQQDFIRLNFELERRY